MSSHLKTIVIWLVVIAAVVIGYQIFDQAGKQREQLDQSTFYRALEDGQIAEVTLNGDAVGYEIRGEFKGSYPGPNGQSITRFSTYIVKDDGLPQMLREHNVVVTSVKPRDSSFLSLLVMRAPLLLFLGVWIFFMRQMQSGGNRARSVGKSRAKLTSSQGRKVTFQDVAGVEEAKDERQ